MDSIRNPFKTGVLWPNGQSGFNQKGGVGKTTTSLNLAAALVRYGHKPVGIDLDPQAQFGFIAGITARSGDDSIFSLFQRNRPLREMIQKSSNGIGIIPSHIELSKVDALYGKGYNAINKLNISLQAEETQGENRHWIIDCCPLVGVLSLNAIFACDGLIVPMSADYLSIKGDIQIQKTLQALERVLKRRVNRRYLITRFDSRRRMARDVLLKAEAAFGADVCRTLISENVCLAESPSLNKTIFEHAPNSRGARDYESLLNELIPDCPLGHKTPVLNGFLMESIRDFPYFSMRCCSNEQSGLIADGFIR